MTSLLQSLTVQWAGGFLMILPGQPLGGVSSAELSVMLMESLSSTQLLLSVTYLIFIKNVSSTRTATVRKDLILRAGQVLLSQPGYPGALCVDQAGPQHAEISLPLPFKFLLCALV